MKSRISALLTFSISFIFSTVYAQDSLKWDIGIISGIQRTYFQTDSPEESSSTFQAENEFVNGFMINYELSDYLLLEGNILHSSKEYHESSSDNPINNRTFHHKSLSIPLLLKSGFGNRMKISIMSGLCYDISLGGRWETDEEFNWFDENGDEVGQSTITQDLGNELRKNQLYAMAGVGIRLPIEEYFYFYTSGRYSTTLNSVYTDGSGKYQHLIFLVGITANI